MAWIGLLLTLLLLLVILALLVLLPILLLARFLGRRFTPTPWPREELKGLVDPKEVDETLRALKEREARLQRALASPRLLPETQRGLREALLRVQEEREELLGLLDSLAAERLLAQGEENTGLKEKLKALREALARLQTPEGKL